MSVAIFETSTAADTVTSVSFFETVKERPGTTPLNVFDDDVTVYWVAGSLPTVIAASAPWVRTFMPVNPVTPSRLNALAAPESLAVTWSLYWPVDTWTAAARRP